MASFYIADHLSLPTQPGFTIALSLSSCRQDFVDTNLFAIFNPDCVRDGRTRRFQLSQVSLVRVPTNEARRVLHTHARPFETSNPIQELVGPEVIVPARPKDDLIELIPISRGIPSNPLRFDA